MHVSHRQKLPWLAAALASCALLTGCHVPGFAIQHPADKQGQLAAGLWTGVQFTALAVGVIVWGLIAFVVVRYRRRRRAPADAVPSQRAEHLPLEVVYPLDVLGAESQGMIGYFFLQAFENALPGRHVVNLVCQTEVAVDDPAFGNPTKFVGPVFSEDEGRRLAALRGWQIRPDGPAWRRVVPSPEPRAIVELPTIRTLVEFGALVICAGGGGIPVVRDQHGRLRGAEAVIDKDLSAALLACDLGADALVILTDVANVEEGFGTTEPHPIGRTTPVSLRALPFPAGSMGPKVEAACRFVEATARPAMIGKLEDAGHLLRGERGTIIEPDPVRSLGTHHPAAAATGA